MKILQNQRAVTPPYSSYVIYLYDKLPTFLPVLLKRIPYREFLEGAIQFLLSKKYDAVVTVGHRPAIVFAVLSKITRAKRKQVVKELFIDEERLSSRCATRLYRWAFKDVSLVITNSSDEIPYMMNWLGLPNERFKFLPWPSNIPVQEILSTSSDYIFACGRSFRDWETFFEAINGLNLRCVIVASKKDFAQLKLPNGVEAYFDIPHDEYLNLLKKSKIVVIPLKKTIRSIGQAAVLEAMAFGKPLISARVGGVLDYVKPELNGIYYEPGNASDLRNAIFRILNDNKLRENLSDEAKKSIQNCFNKQNYSNMMLETMEKVCGEEDPGGLVVRKYSINCLKDRLKLLFNEKERERIRKFQALRFRRLQYYAYRVLFGTRLKTLAVLYNTDKWGDHWYAQHYEKHFAPLRRKRLNILEIGIGGYADPESGGGSLRMWRTYFPKSRIYGIDIYDKSAHDERRIKTFRGSQIEEDFMSDVVKAIGQISIIIDDGSHKNEHVLRTFAFLFPRLSENGIYVIEDTQTSYWPHMGGSSENFGQPDTTVGFLKKLIDGLNYAEFDKPYYEPTYYCMHIVAMHFYHNIVFIKKGLNNEGSNTLRRNIWNMPW